MVASSNGAESYVEEERKSMKTSGLARYGVVDRRKMLDYVYESAILCGWSANWE